MPSARETFWAALASQDSSIAMEAGQLNDCAPVTAAAQAGADPQTIAKAAAQALGIDFAADLAGQPASAEFVAAIPIAFARQHTLLGLASTNGVLPVAMADLRQWPQLAMLARTLGRRIRPLLAPADQILSAVNLAYQQRTGQAQEVIAQLDKDEVLGEVQSLKVGEDLLDVASRAPVIKLVNLILFEAVKSRASDVHIQPYEERLVVRFRIDGVLYDFFTPPKALQEEILSRVKIMGKMNIAEKRLAQDGRTTVEVGDRVIDLRIATLPTSFGERLVIRLLDKSVRLYKLPDLGMDPLTLGRFRQVIAMDHGIVLVTGPTGSGKTTTLYAALREMDSAKTNILTLEDPIEYQLEGISQTQINERKGMTFASGLRHVLRQDPDVIMVGEIRDSETARMAIQSALTGHLVFSTLHTNDAASAVARLLDLGAEPYLLASSLVGVLAQRLVRQVCPQCQASFTPAPADWLRWNVLPQSLPQAQFQAGTGCPYCLNTGYRERAGIFELLTVDEAQRELILERARSTALKAAACAAGMRTLRQDGVAKAAIGATTMDEVMRVTASDDS